MGLLKRSELLLIFTLFFNYVASSPSSIHSLSTSKDKYRRYTEQELHTTIANIEGGLRNVESIHYSVKRQEISLEKILKKVDAIDSRSVRMQAVMDMKLDLLTKAVISTEYKSELMLEQLGKFQDFFKSKINSLEFKLEELNRKTQNQEVLSAKHDTLHEKVDKILSKAETSNPTNIEHYVNLTNSEILKNLKEMEIKIAKNENFEKLTRSLNGIQNHLNQTDLMRTQNDSPRSIDKEKIIDYMNSEAQKLGHKISNMYNDISHKVLDIEVLIKEGFRQENHSSKIIAEDLKTLLVEQRDETFIDINVQKVMSMAHKRFNDLQRKLESNFQDIADAQSLFLSTCHRIQEDEPKLESRVSIVLEKILDVFENGSTKMEKQSLELLEALKSHNTQIMRVSNHNTNMIVTLAEEISQDHKNLDGSIMEVAERADTITSIVQEIQDEIYELNDTVKATPAKCADDKKSHEVRAVEAHYGEGVLKIVTDVGDENVTKTDDLAHLNKTIETKNLHAIVGTTNEPEEKQKQQIGDFLIKIHQKKDEETDITEEVATQLMLSYIKLIREKITLKEFLNEKLTGRSYQNITDMIEHLKPIDTISREFIRELDQYENRLKFDKIYLHENAETLIDQESYNYDDFDLPN